MGSRFYANIEGSARTEATRQGTPRSGIQSHTRGWDVGIKVVGMVRSLDDKDEFTAFVTRGSNNPQGEWVFSVSLADDGGFNIEFNQDILSLHNREEG